MPASYPNRDLRAAAREPLCNVEMEQSLIGSVLFDNRVLEAVAPLVKQDDFFEEIHRRIYHVASVMIGSGQAASPVTLKSFFGDDEIASGITFGDYLKRLRTENALPIMAVDFARGIHDLSVRRRIIEAAEQLAGQAYDLPVEVRPSQIAGESIVALHALVGDEAARTTRKVAAQEVGAIIDRIRRVQNGEAERRIVSTGFDDLDKATGGYKPGDLWVLAARPGMGKTTLFVASANRSARRGAGVLGFALEVGNDQIHSRILADLAYASHDPISFKAIMGDEVPLESLGRLSSAQTRLDALPLVIDVPSRLSPAEIRLRIRAEKDRMASRDVALRVVFIDYLKQVQASDRYAGNRVYEVGEISYALKQIAKDEDLCVVLLAQLNRGLESRDDKRPILSDLRESGDLEADADVVAFLHRESVYIRRSAAYSADNPDAINRFIDCEHEAEIILGKNRSGETRTIKLWCDIACSTMSDHWRSAP